MLRCLCERCKTVVRSAVGRTASWTIPWTDEVRWECPWTEMFADDITICKWEQPEGGRSSQERACGQ